MTVFPNAHINSLPSGKGAPGNKIRRNSPGSNAGRFSFGDMGETVPQLIAELRAHIVRKTGKPIDPDVDFLTTQIEVLSASGPIISANDWGDLQLTRTERRLLDHLASAPGRRFTRGAILNALYFDRLGDEPDAKIIDVYVFKIRRKMIGTQWDIGTQRDGGYSLVTLKDESHRPQRGSLAQRPMWMGVRLAPQMAKIATALHENIGKTLSGLEICKAAAVHKLPDMKYLGRCLKGTGYTIQNVPRRGYRMDASA